jgi:hypothetical protein
MASSTGGGKKKDPSEVIDFEVSVEFSYLALGRLGALGVLVLLQER